MHHQLAVNADLKATSITTDTINSNTTGKMAIDLLNSNISSVNGVTVSNITSQDTRFNSITPISKALALNGDMKVIQDSTIYTDKLASNVAQNLSINSDVIVNPDNILTASNINASALNKNLNPYGMGAVRSSNDYRRSEYNRNMLCSLHANFNFLTTYSKFMATFKLTQFNH